MSESVENTDDFQCCEYNELLQQYIDIIEIRDSLILKKQIYLDAKHIYMSYGLMKEEIGLRIDIKKLKIEKNMFKSSVKLKKILNKDAMNRLINRDINPLREQIIGIDNLVNTAIEYIKSYENDDSYKNELSNLYKKMIVRISPTFNHMDLNKEKIWKKTELAYIYNDLNKLKIISNLLTNNRIATKTYSMEELHKNVSELNNEIQSIKEIFPFNIEVDVDEAYYIKSYRGEIEERILELKENKAILLTEVNILKNKI